jgi:hypothetical protein
MKAPPTAICSSPSTNLRAAPVPLTKIVDQVELLLRTVIDGLYVCGNALVESEQRRGTRAIDRATCRMNADAATASRVR